MPGAFITEKLCKYKKRICKRKDANRLDTVS
jgi:hypothetical protein